MSEVKQAWIEMRDRLLIAVPRWVINTLDGNGDHRYPFVIKAIPVVIVMLSVASISVINTRATAHHAGWNSPLVSTGVAVLVPLATLAAALIRHRGWSALFWVVSFFVAFVSGSIQYQVYFEPGAVGVEALEAYAFGYGIPFAEVLFAIMEAVSINQWMTQRSEAESEQRRIAAMEKRQQQDEADAEARRRLRQQQEAQQAEFERRKREAELVAYEAKLKQDAELEREKALTQLRIKEQKAGRALPVFDSEGDSRIKPENHKAIDYERVIIDYFAENPLSSQRKAAADTNISQSKISKTLNDLESRKIIHRNGNGVEILEER